MSCEAILSARYPTTYHESTALDGCIKEEAPNSIIAEAIHAIVNHSSRVIFSLMFDSSKSRSWEKQMPCHTVFHYLTLI